MGDAGVAEGNSLLYGGDTNPLGAILHGAPRNRDQPVAIRVGLGDESKDRIWADALPDQPKIRGQSRQIDLDPGARIGVHEVIVSG